MGLDKISRKRFLELYYEFGGKIEEWSTLYLDSVAGYSILHERLCGKQEELKTILGSHKYATAEFQDTCSVSYKNVSSKDFSPVALFPVMKQGDFKRRVADDGHNVLLLGNLCVVFAYAFWEEYLRFEVGKALGVIPMDARLDKKHVKN